MLNDVLDPLSECLDSESARRLIEFGIAPSVQEHMSVLACKANEGLLTDDEQTGYEALINAADFIAILKVKVQRKLAAAGNR